MRCDLSLSRQTCLRLQLPISVFAGRIRNRNCRERLGLSISSSRCEQVNMNSIVCVFRRRVCLILVFYLVPALLPLLGQKPVTTQAPTTASTPSDPGWPREVKKDGARLVYYQPQIDEWKEYRELTGDMAVSLTPAGGQPTLGVVSLSAPTMADLEKRTVVIQSIQITSSRFPSADKATADSLDKLLRQLFPSAGMTISLDRILAALQRTKTSAKPVAVKTDPPTIFYSKGPAIMLLVDGEPVRAPIEKTQLEFVVNTNWDLFYDKKSKKYYLLTDQTWLSASDLPGPWAVTGKLPSEMSQLPANQNWDDVKKAIPPTVSPTERGPQVFFTKTPAELIIFNGEPVYAKIAGTHLSFVKNSESDIFFDSTQNQFYFLTSGRWFRANSLDGPWSYAGADLPPDFAKIPEDHPRSHVLASVPGTQEAEDAVLLAEVPTTAVVNRAEAEAKVKVTYVGDPEFKPIESTSLQYAANTQDKVIKYGDVYYLCLQGVWFMSTTAQGPWKTADSIPQEIYTIPPSSPVHNVTYVTVSNPTTTTVETSYTSGYMGMFVVGTAVGLTVAYGTGYYYPPYYYWGPMYPYPMYWGWPVTYGVGAVYNPYTGGFYAGRAAYGPYGAVGGSAWYNPATGRYGRAATAQTWYGGRTSAAAYNPWTGGYGATRQGHNAYAQWGQSAAVRGDDWARTGHVTTARGTVGGIQSSQGSAAYARGAGGGTVVKGSGNNVYAGKDGNVYRKDSSGSWSKYEGGNWNSVDTAGARDQARQAAQNSGVTRESASQAAQQRAGNRTQGTPSQMGSGGSLSPETRNQLNREASARQSGDARVSQQRQYERSGGWSGGGGGGWSRGGGGGRMGGGGRRR